MQKNYDAVISDCTRALKCNPKYTKALHRRAKAREMTKQYENCLEDITAVCILEGFQNQSSLIMADRVLKELGILLWMTVLCRFIIFLTSLKASSMLAKRWPAEVLSFRQSTLSKHLCAHFLKILFSTCLRIVVTR